MYGLLLKGAKQALEKKYGSKICEDITGKLRSTYEEDGGDFKSHSCYSEALFLDLAKVASDVTGDDFETILELFGESFVGFLSHNGYGRMLGVLGKTFRHFLNGLDNLHDYLRFSFPDIQPPSFLVESETASGLTLRYRSQRTGLARYAIGQIKAVARQLYDTDVTVEIVNSETCCTFSCVTMQLSFNNTNFCPVTSSAINNDVIQQRVDDVIIDANDFLDVFPFHVVFGERNLCIRSCGKALDVVLPRINSRPITDVFRLHRPIVKFTAENVSATRK